MPKWKELKRFCDNDGWICYKKTDHYYYRKILENGDILLTKISMGSGEISKYLWQEIRNRQLKVTQEYFNSKI
ncbi:MAG: hypothetical protein IJQ99_08705 [Synergistaceae bacterium]|nr:hypothetical protein [Synergistaceae bacterium]MBR0080637.1 hypothetical protein [Synergistaceae bacterium]MBR0316929.1 hypothetical protein [Synergistaceae bacterium]